MGIWNAADVVNTVLAVVGILLTAVGLAVVFWQVRQARDAAEAASRAATEAREAMAQRLTAVDLGSIHTALRTLQDQLRARQTQAALASCQAVRGQLVALRTRDEARISPGHLDELTRGMGTIAQVQEALERQQAGDGQQMDIAAANNKISTLIDLMVERRTLFLEREEQAP